MVPQSLPLFGNINWTQVFLHLICLLFSQSPYPPVCLSLPYSSARSLSLSLTSSLPLYLSPYVNISWVLSSIPTSAAAKFKNSYPKSFSQNLLKPNHWVFSFSKPFGLVRVSDWYLLHWSILIYPDHVTYAVQPLFPALLNYVNLLHFIIPSAALCIR